MGLALSVRLLAVGLLRFPRVSTSHMTHDTIYCGSILGGWPLRPTCGLRSRQRPTTISCGTLPVWRQC